ncbi:hypothetical protein METBIDRAFT_32261 [Metschnikowia bicuspidata var. bicuspidata NRRL YB-4993]|uniref:Hyphally-regulated cell wall protein N-terminal domain-containing protein n=1 Tax=Metschnikowia bicuspidata var. bicuspidata NRRL YB-4993 TaxID=869754 RepID=A0A1A0H8D3_9ASCO|nr:hypothetical protein METBIDRAFT_32261 [Metschnikowia bicuspidata var. bicuspidata NRRL YB-4993]OBA20240.1 hypothetical protein METBIDRAFT_32261 [Metschnikowia bicuspidata var. bicuspidata NRRL YB-4993]
MILGVIRTAITLNFVALVTSMEIVDRTVANNKAEFAEESLTVSAEVYLSIVNSSRVTFLDSVRNYGSLYVTNRNNQDVWVRMSGQDFENSGTVSFSCLTTPVLSDYHIMATRSFVNTGNMYFGVYGGDYGASPFSVTSVATWTNSGMILFLVAHGESAQLQIQRYTPDNGYRSITNTGSLCLNNTHWPVQTNIEGNGCIIVGSGGQLDLQFSESTHGIAEDQTIYLASSDSLLKILGLESYSSEPPVIKLAGLGGSNRIQFQTYSTQTYRYYTSTGLLNVFVDNVRKVSFNIGIGYELGLFDSTSGILSYSGEPPDSAPDVCKCGTSFPAVPNTSG